MCALGYLLDLPKDRCLTRALPHQLSEVPLGEVSPETGIVRVAPEGLQDAVGQVKDLENFGDPGVILSGRPGKGSDTPEALLPYHQAVPLGALPRGLLRHPVPVGPPGACPDAALAVQCGRVLATQEVPAAVLVDGEVLVGENEVGRLLTSLFHVGVPSQGGLVSS